MKSMKDLAKELAKQGHAVKLDEIHDHSGKLIETRLHHYLTCTKCAEMKKEKKLETTN